MNARQKKKLKNRGGYYHYNGINKKYREFCRKFHFNRNRFNKRYYLALYRYAKEITSFNKISNYYGLLENGIPVKTYKTALLLKEGMIVNAKERIN